jgi:hypothetical protein
MTLFLEKVGLVLIIASVLPIYGQGKTAQPREDQRATENAIKPETDKPATPPEARIVINEETANTQSNRPEDKPKSYLTRLIAPENAPNLVLCLVGFVGIIIALCSLKTIRDQTKATVIAARAAKASADAANLTTQIMINAERALIEIELGPADSHRNEWGMEVSGYSPEETFRFGVKITNHGRTVARIVSYKLWHDMFERNFDRDKFTISSESTSHLLLAAGNSTHLFNVDADELFTDYAAIASNKKKGMMRIDVRYADVVEQREGGHETSVIYFFEGGLEEPRRLAGYNVYK